VSSEPGPGPLVSVAECTSGGNAIQTGAVTAHPTAPQVPLERTP
jgi:hypothetical protein